MRLLIALLLLTVMRPAAWAESADPVTAPAPFVISIYTENDSQRYKPNNPSDRHYTHGTRIVFAHQPAFANTLADALDTLYPLHAAGDPDRRTAFGYSLGQNIYTPRNISATALVRNDRPYAGWLYGSAFLQRSSGNTMDHFEVKLGMVGPASLAEDVQTIVHDLFDSTDPRGWDNQLHDEPAFNVNYTRFWKLSLLPEAEGQAPRRFGVELIPQAGFAVGLVNRHLEAGATLRAGWNLPSDFGPGRLSQPSDATNLSGGTSELGGYVYVRALGRAVEHNLFIEGNNFHRSHSLPIEPLVGEVQLGVALAWRWFELGYSQTFLTDQFKAQRGDHSYGAINASFHCSF